jgi:ribosome-associated heat shock protein Hsp15
MVSSRQNKIVTGVRLDKWLWAARFFKTRSLAAQACDLGRVQLAGRPAKPAREVQVNAVLHVKTPGGDFEVRVAGLSDLRGPASVAQTLYEETEASREARAKAAAERRLNWEPSFVLAGRPSKKNRRELAKIRGDAGF